MALLAPLLEPGTHGIDVGANVGAYTYFMAKRGLRVEAFEPVPACAAALRPVECDKIRVHQLALSDKPGTHRLVVPVDSGRELSGRATIRDEGAETSDDHALEVRCKTLDSFRFKDVSVIKIDVEGHELAVLRGAEETLDRDHPLIVLELELRHIGVDGWQETVDWLERRDYIGFFTPSRHVIKPIGEFDHRRHQRLVHGEPADPYVNNFVFVSRRHPTRFARASAAWGLT